MNARKVLEMGGGTLLVSLPKAWVRKNGIVKGATVSVDEVSARKLMIRPIEDASGKPRAASVEYPGEELVQVANDVIGAYLLGYDLITVSGRQLITREDRAKLKATIGRLIGMEIIDEHAKKMVLQFLPEPGAVGPDKLVRRMVGIIEGMIKDTAEGLSSGDRHLLSLVGERDDEVDRLYFLLVRIIRTATIDPSVAERYELSPVDVLDYRVVASFLESVGDTVAELSKKVQGAGMPREAAREYAATISSLVEMEDLAVRFFLARGRERSRALYVRVREISDEVAEKLASLAARTDLKAGPALEAVGGAERVRRLLVDISDLSVPARSLS